jgi:hypothetical protein
MVTARFAKMLQKPSTPDAAQLWKLKQYTVMLQCTKTECSLLHFKALKHGVLWALKLNALIAVSWHIINLQNV